MCALPAINDTGPFGAAPQDGGPNHTSRKRSRHPARASASLCRLGIREELARIGGHLLPLGMPLAGKNDGRLQPGASHYDEVSGCADPHRAELGEHLAGTLG